VSVRAVVGCVAMLVAAGCSALFGPDVRVDPGLSPHMPPDQVSEVAMGQLRLMEQWAGRTAASARVLSMTATTAEGVVRLEPAAGAGSSLTASVVVWLVRAEGTFTNVRTPPGVEPMIARSGYLIISDADGSIIGSGFP
jgi:hypothetical protein